MTLTRWKLLAGLLGLGMAGVAATADPSCTPAARTARQAPPPAVAVVPPLPGPAIPDAVRGATAPPVVPDLSPPPAIPQVALAPIGLPPATPLPVNVELPKLNEPPPAPPPPAITLTPPPVQTIKALELPAAKPLDVPPPPMLPKADVSPPSKVDPGLPSPAPRTDPLLPTPPGVEPPALTPVRPLVTTVKPDLPPVAFDPPPATLPPQNVPPAARRDVPPLPAPTADPAVRVVLKLGTGQPRFEVLKGDDTLLKVVCDKVDVKSPADKAGTMTPLKAAGNLRFSAPGCEGTCGELVVVPGTGDVELTGDVRVKCKMGKGETEIVANKMTFKLGAAPAYAVSEPDAGTIEPAGRR